VVVIAGLDPAIHAARPLVRFSRLRLLHFSMDHRVEPGGDEVWTACAASRALSFINGLKHDPEKWMPVFGKDHAQRVAGNA
jgi:hypothetical protein